MEYLGIAAGADVRVMGMRRVMCPISSGQCMPAQPTSPSHHSHGGAGRPRDRSWGCRCSFTSSTQPIGRHSLGQRIHVIVCEGIAGANHQHTACHFRTRVSASPHSTWHAQGQAAYGRGAAHTLHTAVSRCQRRVGAPEAKTWMSPLMLMASATESYLSVSDRCSVGASPQGSPSRAGGRAAGRGRAVRRAGVGCPSGWLCVSASA